MGEFALTGCSATPLSGYLSALGVHRAVARTLDAEAEGYWQRGRYVLRCRFPTIDDLAAALHASYQPESIVAPWNSGSGFSAKGTSPTAERIVQWVRDSTDVRLGPLRDAVAGGDRVISEAARLGITDLWDKNRKPEVLRLCRNDHAYLVKFSWTDIVRHVMVQGAASPDDPALADYWAERRRKVKPPLDNYTLRLLARQDARCPLCGDHLLTAEQPPQSPNDWERWWQQVTRQAIAADYLVHHGRSGPPHNDQTRLVHASCRRGLRARRRRTQHS